MGPISRVSSSTSCRRPLLVGGGVAGLVDAGVDAAAHVLDERAEEAPRHRSNGVRGIEDE